ncbi:hypothetical protein ABW02_11755 [Niallia circulans]|uniref:Uncharacterized protein n=1 Tax=Niallia circulans TaxID=1397 RepID=A0A0J1LBQ9_NIACI|nr:hypothetical protein ABW02_11755 [Niallia circulans]
MHSKISKLIFECTFCIDLKKEVLDREQRSKKLPKRRRESAKEQKYQPKGGGNQPKEGRNQPKCKNISQKEGGISQSAEISAKEREKSANLPIYQPTDHKYQLKLNFSSKFLKDKLSL